MRFSYGFGIGIQELSIPDRNFMAELSPCDLQAKRSDEQELRHALANPIGTGRLRELVRFGMRIAIVADCTFPADLILPSILDELYTGGVRKEDIVLLFTSANNVKFSSEELRVLAGSRAADEITVSGSEKNEYRTISIPDYDIPVNIAASVLEADFRILLGSVNYHPLYGYTGGLDAIFPLCSTLKDIGAFYAHTDLNECRPGTLRTNPLRKVIDSLAASVGPCFMMNVIFGDAHKILHAFAGDPVEAHHGACHVLDAVSMKKIPFTADIAVVSAGGSPSDRFFSNVLFDLDTAINGLKQGGAVLLIASCKDGIGNPSLSSCLSICNNIDLLRETMGNNYLPGSELGFLMARAIERASVYIISELEDNIAIHRHFIPGANAQYILDELLKRDSGAKVLSLPHGRTTLPVIFRTEN